MRKIWMSLSAAVLLAACATEAPKVDEAAQRHEAELQYIYGLETQVYGAELLDPSVGRSLMIGYTNFSNAFPEDTLAPEFLFKAGSIARNLGSYEHAIELFTHAHDGYPAFDKRVACAYLVAFVYDNDLNDRLRAEEAYKQVVALYPDHHLASDAQARLQTLHMTDAELIEHFEQMNAAALKE